MPNGRTHRKLTWALITLSPLSLAVVSPLDFLWLAGGLAVTLSVTPDLDLHNPAGGIGRVIGLDTYKRLVPHRAGLSKKSWQAPARVLMFSHLPIIGTIARFLLVSMPIVLVLLLAGISPPLGFVWLFVGMAISDIVHIVADITVSSIKKNNHDRMKYYYHRKKGRYK